MKIPMDNRFIHIKEIYKQIYDLNFKETADSDLNFKELAASNVY